MAKLRFTATVVWTEEVDEDEIKKLYLDEDDSEPTEDDMKDLLQDWIVDREHEAKEIFTKEFENPMIKIETDEI